MYTSASFMLFELNSKAGGGIREVKQAEERLGFRFPRELRNYLINLGCISILDHKWNGLGLDVNTSSSRNIVEATLLVREYFKAFPADAVVLEETMGGNFVVVDIKGEVKLFDGGKLHAMQPSISSYAFSLNPRKEDVKIYG